MAELGALSANWAAIVLNERGLPTAAGSKWPRCGGPGARAAQPARRAVYRSRRARLCRCEPVEHDIREAVRRRQRFRAPVGTVQAVAAVVGVRA
jgi:hypothetical protein